MRQPKLIIAALFVFSPFAANADLILGLCDGTADDTVTCDTDTELEWLDVTLTNGLSADDFLSNVGGWIDAGWSFATGDMFNDLLLNAGATNLSVNDAGNIPAIALINDLLGTMGGCSEAGLGACVMVSDSAVGAGVGDLAGWLAPDLILGAGNFAAMTYADSGGGVGIAAFRQGSTSVPEPGTLALLGIGLAGMGLARRRRKV